MTNSQNSGKGDNGNRKGPVWIVVAKTFGNTQALMMAERLRSVGIPAIVEYESVGSVMGMSFGPLGEARVLVPESFFEQTQQLLDTGETNNNYNNDMPLPGDMDDDWHDDWIEVEDD